MADKTLNELSRDLRALYTRGAEAVQRDNFDYAIEMYMQILAKEPSVFEVRKALRATQTAKSGKSGGFFKRMVSSASSSPALAKGQMALRKSPLEAMQIAEDILNSDANSTGGHKLLAEAALAAGMPRVAVMSLEVLVQASPKDKPLSFQLAEAFADSGEKTRAEKVLTDLQREYPSDNEIFSKLKDLSARKTMDEGGYGALAEGKGSYRDVLKDKAESIALEQEKRPVKSEDVADGLIKDWEARLKAEPNNVKMLRNLAETHASKNEFDKAQAYYDRILAVDNGADSSLLKQIAETRVRKFKHALAQLDTTAADYSERAAQIKAEMQAFQVEECKQRSERYPTDLQIRFELGQLYFEAGKISEAMQEFQKAQANPNRRVQSITYLAKCFEKRNMFDMAVRRLQEVLKEKLSFDEEKKDLIYTLASVFEKMNKKDEAIEQFHKAIDLDPRFYYTHWNLAEALEMKGNLREALAEYKKAVELDDDPFVLALLGQAYAKLGQRDEALKILAQLPQIGAHRYVSAYSYAVLHMALGEKDKAIEWLERSYRDGAGLDLIFLKVDPMLDPLQKEPRFQALVARVFAEKQ